MSKSIKMHFNTLFVILFAVVSLNACQKQIATPNGQILYDPNEEAYSYAGQTVGRQQDKAKNRKDKQSREYQRQQQEIMDLYNKNQNINPDSSKNIDENYYYAGQTSANTTDKKKDKQENKNVDKKKEDKNKQNNTNVVAPVVLNNAKDKQTAGAIDKLNQPTKSADGKYTYVSDAKKAGMKNTSTDNIITDRELNDKLYKSTDRQFKQSKLDKVNKRSGVYSNKEEIISGKTGGSSSSAASGSSWGSSSKSSSIGSSSGSSGSFGSSASSGGSGASAGLSSADKAALGTSIGTGGASLGASGASLITSLTGKGTSSAVSQAGSKAGEEALKNKATEPVKDATQNKQEQAKEQQKKEEKKEEKKQNKQLYIQVNRYNNAQWAKKVFNKLKKSYPNASSRVEGTQTVLLVGPYPNKMVAQAVKSKLISEGFTGAFFTKK